VVVYLKILLEILKENICKSWMDTVLSKILENKYKGVYLVNL